MLTIGIIHNSLNPLGGAERLCLATIEAFKENGWKVVLGVAEPVNWGKIYELWGKTPKPDKEIVLSLPIKGFTLYKRLLPSLLIPRLRRITDIIINTHGDILVANADITYIHFPTFALWNTGYHKYEKGFWRLYFTPYYMVQKHLASKHINTLLLTNSRFSASVIHKMFKRHTLVIYPPVNIEKYLRLEGKRENIVVTIGRFSHEKRYEFIVDVANKLPDTQFYIIGSVTNNRESRSYYNKIKSMIERKDVKNIELLPNAPDRKVLEILSISKVYLHAMINEHFGISIIEGMASGLVPVVHKSGGPWIDIVEYGRYGYGYMTIGEATTSIRKAIENYSKLKEHVRKRTLIFDKNNYKSKIVYVVKKYVGLSR